MTDLELFELEIDTLWDRDERGRLVVDRGVNARPAPHLVVGVAKDGRTVAIGSEVPDDVAVAVEAAVAASPLTPPETPPAALARCEALLEENVGPVQQRAGLGYWVPPGTAFDSDATIHRSSSAEIDALRSFSADRDDWSDEEWLQLLDGAFGPWAVATAGERVIAICHSARLTGEAAEAGVWTDAEHRGRGHAPAVTAAWAASPALAALTLFYSTSSDNTASQRVAAKLGLRPLGWIWYVINREAEAA